MKKIIFSNIVLFSFATVINASELNNLNDFESLLNEASDIATKKSINVDYLPSVVTVIDAQTYIDGGIQNVGEAIGMLPGIQIHVNRLGYNITTVRGLKNPNAYLSDKLKILIDGVAMNNEIQGSSSFFMDFPIQLVDKIEVLRGPGSTVYGEGAFYATINIITKLGNNKNENKIFLGTGSYDDRTIAGNFNTTSGDWKIYTDAYYKQNNKHIEQESGFSDNGNDTDEAMKDVTLGFKATNGDFEFLARYKKSSYGNFYGAEEDLDPIGNQDKEHSDSYFFTEFSYKTLFNDYKLETKVNYSHREQEIEANIYGVTTIANRFDDVNISMQEGFFTREKTAEQNFVAEVALTFPKIKSNEISVGAGARRAEIIKDEFYSSVENAITQNRAAIEAHPNFATFRYRPEKESAFWANPTTKILNGNPSRNILYVHAQDLISVSKKLDAILGLRIDDYSDIGTMISKRAAVVYRASDKTIFKLLYGSAFRAPTLIENYANGHINFRAGDENIKPEYTDTYEISAIYSPNFNNKFSLNMFYSDLKHIIDLEEQPNTDPGYENYDSRISKGIEFEYFFRTKMKHNFYFNASYIDTIYTVPKEDVEPAFDQDMPDISKVMFKAMYIYTPVRKLSFGTTWHYYSETTRTELSWIDETDDVDVDSYNVFDETITYRASASSTIRLTIKNILDEEVNHPSYYYNHDGGVRREGRNFFFSYSYTF